MKWQSVALSAIVAVLASGAIALAGPIGPSVQSQTNPIRSFTHAPTGKFGGKYVNGVTNFGQQPVFTVPAGSVFVITDVLVGERDSSTTLEGIAGCVYVSGVSVLCLHDKRSHNHQAAVGSKHVQLKTGLPVKAGSKVELGCRTKTTVSSSSSTCVITITGYLARP